MRRGAHAPAPAGRNKTSAAFAAIGVLLLLCGAVLLFLPLAQNAASQASMDQEIARVQDFLADGSADGSADADGGSASAASAADLSGAKEKLERYNRRVAAGEVSIAADPFSFEEALGSFGSQGLEDGLVGYIDIPKMGVSMPLYLGATAEHMAKGATVVSGSSAPIGGESTNCVIAAHRGYRYAAMFRDIEELAVGDGVYLRTLWGDLAYTVVNTKVISPSDTAAVGVQQGRDMVSLLTCHPYGHNYSRYIVECERGEGGSAGVDAGSAASDQESAAQPSDSGILGIPLPRAENYLRAIGAALLLLSAAVLLVGRIRASHERRGCGE